MMGLTMCEGKFVGRDEIAMVPTPTATASWKPVPHSEVIDAVTDVVKAHRWTILDEQYGLARDGQRMFGMIRINKSSSMEWSRCIGIRNSHDRTIAVGLAAGFDGQVLFKSHVRRQHGSEATAYLADRIERPRPRSGRRA